MLNLMKYELIKQKTSKIILAGFLIVSELAFILGILLDKEDVTAMASGVLVLVTVATFFTVGLEAITTYFHDLQEKSGYMLFMTPHSVYTIMGSKILTGILSILAATLIFAVVFWGNVMMIEADNGTIGQFFSMIQGSIKVTTEELSVFDIDYWYVLISIIVDAVFGWIGMVSTAFLAITICMTLISGVRGKGFISFIIFCVINWGYNLLVTWIEYRMNFAGYMGEIALTVASTIVLAAATFFCTGYLLKKELSL